MKKSRIALAALAAGAFCMAVNLIPNARAGDTNAPAERIGVYDSRVVAYAHFTGEANMRKLSDSIKAAREAQAAGQTERFRELSAALQKRQEQAHLVVFGSAPATEALADIKDLLPEIQKKAGVTALVSKWDEAGLKAHPKAEQVDVTDALAAAFHPGEKQLQMIESIKKTKPASAEQLAHERD